MPQCIDLAVEHNIITDSVNAETLEIHRSWCHPAIEFFHLMILKAVMEMQIVGCNP